MTKRNVEALNFAERWFRDGQSVLHPPFSVMQVAVDMTHAVEQLEGLRRSGVAATHTHLLLRAAARALAANPDIHQIVAGSKRLRPSRVDIGLSISGDTFVAPVLVISDVDRKGIAELVNEVTRRVPETQEADRELQSAFRRWGWLLPFGFLRRMYLRFLFKNPDVRLQGAGALQITMVAADWAAVANFLAPGVLVGGRIHSCVVAAGNQPVVRPIMLLTFSSDHGVWNGRDATRLISAIKEELEKGTL